MIPIAWVLAAVIYLYFLVDYLRGDKLRKFPGPLLASKTSLWQLWYYYRGERKPPNVDLHQKYGDVVRVAPNKLFFSSPAAVKDIYSTTRNLKKSEYYSSQEATNRGQIISNFFMTTDSHYHDTIRRIMGRGFLPINVPQYEPKIDEVISTFIEQLRIRFADKPGPEGLCDLGMWFGYVGMDSMGNITYSKPYGFVETGKDIDNIMRDNNAMVNHYKYASAAPWVERLTWKNPILLELNRRGYFEGTSPYFVTAAKQHGIRQEEINEGKNQRNDLLTTFFNAKATHPDIIDDMEIMKVVLTIIAAGGDTTGGVSAATCAYLMKNAEAYSKLQKEIDSLPADTTYKDLIKLPYLEACLKETMRLFPVAQFAPERITPPEGMDIAGYQVPGGVVVGATAFAVHRDPVFGDDVEKFLPERWLNPVRNKEMSSKLFTFGTGKYQCIGMHIAWMQLYKNLFRVLRAFKFEMVQDWNYGPGEVIQVQNLLTRVTSRKV